jgi:hypothetical protein
MIIVLDSGESGGVYIFYTSKRYSGSTIHYQIQNIDAKESAKPAVSRLDWRKYGQKSIS